MSEVPNPKVAGRAGFAKETDAILGSPFSFTY